jgi:soluble lytic murein transglycosylase-like protein
LLACGAAAFLALAPASADSQEHFAARPDSGAALDRVARPPSRAAPLWETAAGAFNEFASGRPQRAYDQAARLAAAPRSASAADAHWIAGLSAWRLQRFDSAIAHFAALAALTGTTPHRKAATAFWLARAHLYARKPQFVDMWLARAAMHHGTFYGAIAAHQLAKSSRSAMAASLRALHVPTVRPSGGWTLDRALVFAIMRQESAFNSASVSSAGAVGLMQVLPETARALAGAERYRGESERLLFDAGTNTALGQRFLELMLGPEHFSGSLVLAIAAYNAGPKSVAAWHYRDDPLSFIEAIPYEETRQYVPRVLLNLWMYQWRFNQEAASLEALASNEWPIYEPADLPAASGRADASRRKTHGVRYRGK